MEDLCNLRFGVRVDQRGRILRDFHTAHDRDGKSMPLSHRYYLSDALFVAGVEGPKQLIESLAQAIDRPKFPLYLGRRSCVPSAPVNLGVHEADLPDALRRCPWQAAPWYMRQQGAKVHLELVLDAEASDTRDGMVRDVPISFDPSGRSYGWRDITRPEPVIVDNPDGRHETMDFLAVHGGA